MHTIHNYSSEFCALKIAIWAAQVDDTQSIIIRATAECFQFQICIVSLILQIQLHRPYMWSV